MEQLATMTIKRKNQLFFCPVTLANQQSVFCARTDLIRHSSDTVKGDTMVCPVTVRRHTQTHLGLRRITPLGIISMPRWTGSSSSSPPSSSSSSTPSTGDTSCSGTSSSARQTSEGVKWPAVSATYELKRKSEPKVSGRKLAHGFKPEGKLLSLTIHKPLEYSIYFNFEHCIYLSYIINFF